MMFYEYFKNGLLLWRLSEQLIHISLRKERVANGYVLIIQDTLTYISLYAKAETIISHHRVKWQAFVALQFQGSNVPYVEIR